MTDDYDAVMGRDRVHVAVEVDDEDDADFVGDDGTPYEELELFNHASVTQTHYVNSVNGHESYEAELAAGDDVAGPEPDAVTLRLATELDHEFGIDCIARGIRVVDVTDEEVQRI